MLLLQKNLHRQNIVACIWDFDKTLIPGYMQVPIFEAFGIDEEQFWKEVNALPDIYAKRGTRVSYDTIYLNHLISFVKNGCQGLDQSAPSRTRWRAALLRRLTWFVYPLAGRDGIAARIQKA